MADIHPFENDRITLTPKKMNTQKPTHLQLIIPSCVAGIFVFLYREGRYKNVFKFMKKFPGFSIAIGTSAFCLSTIYVQNLWKINFE